MVWHEAEAAAAPVMALWEQCEMICVDSSMGILLEQTAALRTLQHGTQDGTLNFKHRKLPHRARTPALVSRIINNIVDIQCATRSGSPATCVKEIHNGMDNRVHCREYHDILKRLAGHTSSFRFIEPA